MSTPSSSRSGTGLGNSPQSGAASLRLIRTVKSGSPHVNVVLVPGIGAPPCDSWGVCSEPWAGFFNGLSTAVSLYSYNHGLVLHQLSGWESILEQGTKLLVALQRLQHEQTESNAPIIFICHGFGGSILKQALCVANTNYERHSLLIKTICGIVFLGTPHRLEGVSPQQFGERLSYMLKFETGSGSMLTRQAIAKLKDESGLLLDLANRFNKASYRVDVLSVFELRVSRVKDNVALMSKTRKIIVVDQALCTIFSQAEQPFGADLDHMELPTMTDAKGRPIEEMRQWLEFVIEASSKNVAERLADHDSSSSSSSVISLEDVKLVLGRQLDTDPSHDSTGRAKMGSIPDVESLLDNFSMKRADPRVPCFMVDTFVRNKDFFGREEQLKSLDACLLPSTDLMVSSQPDRIRVASLCGMGGLGKTETAIEYVYSRRGLFDAIFWIRAEDSSKIENDIAQIAVRLGINDPTEPDDRAINKSIAIEWLCNPTKMEHSPDDPGPVPASWLIVFDNADDPELLSPFQDIAMRGSVIITSRNPLANTSLSSSTTSINIQPFTEDAAGQFVQRLTFRSDHFDEAKKIGARLGGLPLALAQMAGMIRLQFLSFSEFLDLYEDTQEQAELHETTLQPLRKTARGTISTIWALEKLPAEAACLLDLLAFLDPDCIQESLLSSSVAEITLEDYPRRKLAFFEARKQLIGASLVRRNDESSEFWIHRLTQDVVRTRIRPDRMRTVFENAVAIVLRAWPAPAVGGHAVELWAQSESLYPHVTSLCEAFKSYFIQENAPGDVPLAELLVRAAWYQHERGESWKVKPLLELALDICNRVKSVDLRDLMSDIRYVLGAVANETNDAASCMVHTKSFLEIRLEVAAETGVVDERLARAHNERGIAWMMARDFEKGEKAFSTAAATYEKIPNYTKDKRSLALANLGLALWLQGRLVEASETLELGLADRMELYGEMDTHSFRTGRFLHALGNVRYSQGRIKESEELHGRALKQYQSTIRNWHHRTADVCHKVAQHCLRNGLHENAVSFMDQALKAWSVDQEKYLPEIARTSFLKSKAMFAAGSEDEANVLFRKAVSLIRKVTHNSHRTDGDLTEDDFDNLVTFWSR